MKVILKYKGLLLCFGLLLISFLGFSQNSTAQWTAESYLVQINGTTVEIKSNLSMQQSVLSWQQISNLSDRTTTFSVTGVTDNWDWEQQTGSIAYTLSSEDGNANLTITSTDDQILMNLTQFDQNGNPIQNYLFTIDSLTNL